MTADEKVCFVIAPIGEDGSPTRRRSDQILKHIIQPAAQACGFTAIRADRISQPGMITHQVIKHVLDDSLVIADLSGPNANVFYELAIRHAVRKPIVQIIAKGERLPFDIAETRTIPVDYQDLDSAAACREELERQIRAVLENPALVDSPLSMAIDIDAMRQSDSTTEQRLAQVFEAIADLRRDIERPKRRQSAQEAWDRARMLSRIREHLDQYRDPGSSFPQILAELERGVPASRRVADDSSPEDSN